MVARVGPLLDHGQQEGGDEVVDLARERARDRADPETQCAQHEVQPAVQAVGGERGAARGAGDPDDSGRPHGCALGQATAPSRSRTRAARSGPRRRTSLHLHGRRMPVASVQLAAAQQLARSDRRGCSRPCAARRPSGSSARAVLRVLDRAARQGMMVERQDAVGVGGLQPPPLGAAAPPARRTSPACWRRCRAGTAATASRPQAAAPRSASARLPCHR